MHSGTPSLPAVRRRLASLANPADAAFLQRFFKTGPGQYGEGDKFLGIRVPETRAVAKDFRDLPLADVERLLADPWHEARLLALILLTGAYDRGSGKERVRIYRLYLANAKRVNNWDLVDASAPGIVGQHLLVRPRATLDRLARSESLWERRIAIVSTLAFIRADQFEDTLRICDVLSTDAHDLIHKACGWMLREVGKRDRETLERFLDAHAATLPRTALRYAIERLPLPDRGRYMAARAQLKSHRAGTAIKTQGARKVAK